MSTPKIIISQSIKSKTLGLHTQRSAVGTFSLRDSNRKPRASRTCFLTPVVKGKLNEHKCTFQSKGRIMETSSVLAISFKYIIIMALFLVIFLFIYCVVLTL